MSRIDLTKQCALCGGKLKRSGVVSFEFGSLKDMERAAHYHDNQYNPRWLDTEFKPCVCTDREHRGPCGECAACYAEEIGFCACKQFIGGNTDGCFKCQPEKHKRPPCPCFPSSSPTSHQDPGT